jgi:hypothetical protein
MPQGISRNASRERLAARDHVQLMTEDPIEGIAVRPRCSGHARIMPTGSDKRAADQNGQMALKVIFGT